MSYVDYAAHREGHDPRADNASAADPMGWGIPFTFHPMLFAGSTNVGANDRSHYGRVQNGGRITKLGIWVGAQSGNITLAVYRGTQGRNPPTTRLATTGAVACPAVNYQEVALDVPVNVDSRTDWFAITADNTTATFGRVSASAVDTAMGTGLSYRGTLLPNPAVSLTAANRVGFIIVGVA